MTFFTLNSSGFELSASYAQKVSSVQYKNYVDLSKWLELLSEGEGRGLLQAEGSRVSVRKNTSSSKLLFLDFDTPCTRDCVTRTLLVSSIVKCAARDPSS